MATSTGQTRYCERCNRVLQLTDFYKSNNLKKYPDGYLRLCKKCLTAHVDSWNPETYLWILQEVDVPYVPEEWNGLLAKYAKPGVKMSGTSVIGRYLSKMRLRKWNQYRWKDNDFIRDLNLKRVSDSMKVDGYDENKIAKTIDQMRVVSSFDQFSTDRPEEFDADPDVSRYTVAVSAPPGNQAQEEDSDPYGTNIAESLTEEDLMYLRLKWGKGYKPEEWVTLEKFFNDMMNSYDIQGAGQIDNLKMLCKTSLKANQLLDLGD